MNKLLSKQSLIITLLVISTALLIFTLYQYNRINKAVDVFSYKVESAEDEYDVAKAYLELQEDLSPILKPLLSEASDRQRRVFPDRPRTVTPGVCPNGQIGYNDQNGVWTCFTPGPGAGNRPCPPGQSSLGVDGDGIQLCGETNSGGSGSGGTGGGWFTGLCGSGGRFNDYLCPIGGRPKPKGRLY